MNQFNDDIYNQIADYLADSMPFDEKVNFEKELKVNENLRNELAKVQLVKKIAERNALREKIKLIQTKKLEEWAAEEKPSIQFQFYKTLGMSGMAASIALFFFLNFTAFTLPNEADLALRGAGDELTPVQKDNFNNFFQGQDALRKGKNKEAIFYFNKVTKSTTIRKYYKDAALWYMATANVDKYPEQTEKLVAQITDDKDFKFKISNVDKLKIKCKTFINKHF